MPSCAVLSAFVAYPTQSSYRYSFRLFFSLTPRGRVIAPKARNRSEAEACDRETVRCDLPPYKYHCQCPPPPVYFLDWWTRWTSGQQQDNMPSAAAGTPFALRMDWVDADKDPFRAWLGANANSWLVVHEVARDENPHVHVLLYSDKNLDALRKSFKRAFAEKRGNGSYSLKPCDDDVNRYVQYMCKGPNKDEGPDIVFRHGLVYTDADLSRYHSEYWAEAEARKPSRVKGNVVEQLLAICQEKGVNGNQRSEIAKEYIRMMRDRHKPINVFAARACVNTVSVLLDPTGSAEDWLVSEIAQPR